jgi:hypothetical protein
MRTKKAMSDTRSDKALINDYMQEAREKGKTSPELRSEKMKCQYSYLWILGLLIGFLGMSTCNSTRDNLWRNPTRQELLYILRNSDNFSDITNAGFRLYQSAPRDDTVSVIINMLDDWKHIPTTLGVDKTPDDEFIPEKYDLDFVWGRAAWILEKITRRTFGFNKNITQAESPKEQKLRREKAREQVKIWWGSVAKPYSLTNDFINRISNCSNPDNQINLINYIVETTMYDEPNSADIYGPEDWGPYLFHQKFYLDDFSFALINLLKSDAQLRVKESALTEIENLSYRLVHGIAGGVRGKYLTRQDFVITKDDTSLDILKSIKSILGEKLHVDDACKLKPELPTKIISNYGRLDITETIEIIRALYDSNTCDGQRVDDKIWVYPRTWDNEYDFWMKTWKTYRKQINSAK